MIGMVLVTHGRLAEELIGALEHVVGAQSNVDAVCIGPDDDMEQRRSDIMKSAIDVDEGNGVVLLTDMFGGTPSNLATAAVRTRGSESLRLRRASTRLALEGKARRASRALPRVNAGASVSREVPSKRFSAVGPPERKA